MTKASNFWGALTLGVVLTITGLRIVALVYNQTDLFVDEAQYWLWGQNLDFGYFSKPPMIGWILRAFVELGNSSDIFWVRVSAPLFHAVTAVLIGLWGRQLASAKVGFWAALAYLTLPINVVASLLISTDTIMAPFFLAGLIFYTRLMKEQQARYAVATGILIGLAFMSKYAGAYFFLGAVVSAVFVPTTRISRANIAWLLLSFVLTVSPNIVWNITHELTTIDHTLDNVGWVTSGSAVSAANFSRMATFVLGQTVVFGPVFSVVFIVLMFGARSATGRMLFAFSIPVLIVVSFQAFLSRAYANWAMAAFYAATILVVMHLVQTKRMKVLISGLALNLFIAVALPVFTLIPEKLSIVQGQPFLARYIGRARLSETMLALAEERGAGGILATSRDILADLHYTGRNSEVSIYSTVTTGSPRNYYEQNFPLPKDTGDPLLFVGFQQTIQCDGVKVSPVLKYEVTGDAYDKPVYAFAIPGNCF